MIVISSSRAAVARGCWMKYKWRYIDHLESIRQASALTLGKILHAAFDRYYKGATNDYVRSYIISTFNDEISIVPLPDQEDLVIARYTALGAWDNYPYKNLNEFQKIYSEEDFIVRLGNTRGIRFRGRVDGRILKDNVWWVRELKTTFMTQRQFEGRASTSAQASGYVYALRKLNYPIHGVMYDVIKKPLLRKRKDETVHDFGKRILEDYADKNRQDFYYKRHYTYRNEVDLKLFEEGMVELVKEIRRRTKAQSFYRNPDACWNFNTECPFKKICWMEKPDPLTLKLYFKKEVSDATKR